MLTNCIAPIIANHIIIALTARAKRVEMGKISRKRGKIIIMILSRLVDPIFHSVSTQKVTFLDQSVGCHGKVDSRILRVVFIDLRTSLGGAQSCFGE